MHLTLDGKGWASKADAEVIWAWVDYMKWMGDCLVSTLSETPPN